MKIALTLYGKMREFEKCIPAWNKFIKKYDPDIFLHTWNDDIDDVSPEGRPPISMMISEPINFSHLHLGIDQYSSSAVNVLPQTYSIMQSDKLRTDYERLMEFKYDWVVRSRFDLALHTPEDINFESFKKDYVYVCANHWPGQNNIYDDNFMIGSWFDMGMISSNLFEYAIAQINAHKVIPSGEQLLSKYLERRTSFVVKDSSLNFTLGRNL